MRKVLIIASWVLGISLAAVLVAFENISEKNTQVVKVEITLQQPENQLFVNESDIQELLNKQDDSLIHKSLNTINSAMLEESLENHPFIADAEVFSTLDGILSVQVEQKLAIARVISTNKHYYLDANCHPFPLTESYSAAVPVFTGKADSTSNYNAFSLLQTISNTAYFTNWLAEIHTTSTGEIELIPQQGNHRVLFGKAEKADEKLKKLEAFYKTVITTQNLSEWKTLNVGYENLLVSTKHD